jgi:hypothetical protein
MYRVVGDVTTWALKTYARSLHSLLIISMSIYCVSAGWTQ